jgi:inner membrane protein YidH
MGLVGAAAARNGLGARRATQSGFLSGAMANSVITSRSSPDEISVELSSRRTGMSFQRTRMSADRTLMSIIRTSLSLISFGFTIFQFFSHLKNTELLESESRAPGNFGTSLVLLGATMLAIGIWYHVNFMWGLRKERKQMTVNGLVHGESGYPVSLTLIIALLLFLVGLLAATSMIFEIGPFD